MSKHTPGPWVAKQEYANRWRIESHANGPEFIPISVGIACTTVLEVGCGNEDTGANAHLIAAAPELLEALKETLPFMIDIAKARHPQFEPTMADDDSAIGKAMRAIAKAEGRP